MEDATFRPTPLQALGHGLYLGALVALVGTAAALITAVILDGPVPAWFWALSAFGPPLVGALVGVVAGRWTGVRLGAGGIRTQLIFAYGLAPWHRVVDMRAERRGGRTVVAVYLDSGVSVRLRAPYSGGLFAADPQFDSKMLTLSHIWRSHRFGGLPG